MTPSQSGDKTPTLSNVKPAKRGGHLPSLSLILVDKMIHHRDNSMSNSRYEMPLCSSHTVRKNI